MFHITIWVKISFYLCKSPSYAWNLLMIKPGKQDEKMYFLKKNSGTYLRFIAFNHGLFL